MMELHRASFVEWQPTPVVSVKATSHFFGGKCVALARENGDLEMYDAHSWRLIGRVPGKDGDSISRLEWVQPFRVDGVSEEEYEELEEEEEEEGEESLIKSSGVGSSEKARLVSVALDGTVTEWDLNQLKPHSTCESHGGSIWDCASEPMKAVKPGQPQRLAIACDDGCVRLVISMAKSAVGGGLRHKEALPKVSGKVLSVCWNKDGTRIAAGTSEGRIHVFDVESKREIECVLIGNQPPKHANKERHRNPNSLKKKRNRGGSNVSAKNHDPTCVWKMLYLPDDTLVTADSDGNVTFHDSRFYTVLKRFSSHDADVVALAVAPDGKIVFASGVDHKIVAYENLDDLNRNDKGFNEWVQTSMKRPHTHDVKCLEMVRNSKVPGGVLLSAGVDAQLLAHRADAFGKKHPVRVVSVPRKTPIAVTSTAMHTFNESSSMTTPVGTPSNGNDVLSERSAGFKFPDPPLAMCEHGRYVDVWKLGEALGTTTTTTTNNNNNSQNQQENLNTSNARKKQRTENTQNKKNRQLLRSAPECVLRLFVSGRHSILCSAISPDGCWVVLSDAVSPPRIFAIREPNSKEKEDMNSDDEEEEAFFDGATDVKRKSGWRAKKVELPEEITRPAAHLLFTADAKRLIIVSIRGPIKIIDLENWEVVGTLRAHIATKTATQRAFAKESGRRRSHKSHTNVGGFEGGECNMVTADTVGCPAVTNICCSGDSQWLAVASCRAPNVVSDADNAFSANANVGGVFIYSMDAMKLHSRLPPPLNMDSWSAIHAMAFNETRVLAIACGTSNSLWTIDVETGEPLPWSLNLAKRNAHAPDALYNTPGQICGLSFAIGGGSEKGIVSSKRGKSASSRKSTAAANKDAGLPELVLFAHTPNAIARINLRSKITDDCVLSKLGKSKVLTGTAKKKRRQREKQLKEKQASQRVDGAIELPGGVRAVILNDPCLFFGNVGKDKALLVERPWVDVLRKMQKPLYRHRFGT